MKESGRIGFFRDLARGEWARRFFFLALIAATFVIVVVTFVKAIGWVDKPFPGFLVNQRMVLGGVGQYHWTGTTAGLNYPDKVLSANGRAVKTPMDLEEVVSGVDVGDNVSYQVEREGKTLEIVVATMRFSLSDFLVLYGIFFVAGVIYLVNVAIVFFMKPDSEASWAFLWTFLPLSHNMLTTFDITATHVGFIRTYMIVIWLVPFSAIYLSLHFPERRKIVERRPWIKHVLFAIPLLMAIPMEWSYPGPLYVALYNVTDVLMVVSVVALLTSILYSFFRKTSAVARQRAKVVLLGAAVAFPLPASLQLYMSFGKTIGSYQVLNNFLVLPLVAFPVSIAYAIAHHNLFDVDVYIKRTVGYAIMTAVVAGAYWGIQVFLESIIIGPLLGDAAGKVYPFVFALLVVFLFNPLNRQVQGGVDRLFYRKKFDYKETVVSVSEALSSIFDLEEIVRKIIHTTRDTMFIDTSGLVLAGAQGETLRGHFIGEGKDRSGVSEDRDIYLAPDDPLVTLVSRERRMITKYDVAEDPRFAPVRDTCGRRFEELEASLAVPLVHKGEVKGILAVGHKKSGRFFTREDVELLQTLASQGAVAIENANLAEQMKKEEVVRANLSRYLSPQIVDRIVKEDVKVNLGGDRKVVTVLFSDIRNFTTITESRPPDQLVAILNEYFTEMAGVIFENQGSLDKYIGDAVVAVFGSLIPLESPPRNAVAAAIGMMKKVSELNRHWEGRYAFSMNIGIGVATGEVFLGNVGSPERMEFTVIGDAVNVASRFSGLARGGQILVTKPVADSLGGAFRLATLPPAEVKGKSGRMEVFEVLCAEAVS